MRMINGQYNMITEQISKIICVMNLFICPIEWIIIHQNFNINTINFFVSIVRKVLESINLVTYS